MTPEPFNPNLIRVPPDERAFGATRPMSVSQLTALVKDAIEVALPSTVHVVGEISNYKHHSSGHLYLTLKDRSSELSCVMWRSDAGKLKFKPGNGMEVIATGKVSVFERTGRYQLYVRKLEPRGVGALELAFRQLREKLEKEGLFDPARKRRLPTYPRRIAIVTSPTGAALHDMLRTIERRFPCLAVLVYPVAVQGEEAAGQIARAIRRINENAARLGGIDLLIVGRGGGSLEDLWAFNEEVVARAIHAGTIPVISAVGHEVDVTISDLVADVRAATPTAAAELAVPVLDDVLSALALSEARLTRACRRIVELQASRFAGLQQRTAFRAPLESIRRREQLIDELSGRLERSLVTLTRLRRRRIDALEPCIRRISPERFLLRTSLKLRDVEHRLSRSATRRLTMARQTLESRNGQLERASPRHDLPGLRLRMEALAEALPASMNRRMANLKEQVRREGDLLSALSYKSVLRRGFSITRAKKGRRALRSVQEIRDRDRILTELADGEFEADVVNRNQLELFD